MRKRILKLLSTVLAIIIILGVLPLSTFAAEVDSGLALEESIKDTAAKSEKMAEIIAEVKSRRDEFTKVFRKNDGTYTAIISSSPIHYKKDGQWEDIDNTLTQKSKGGNLHTVKTYNYTSGSLPAIAKKIDHYTYVAVGWVDKLAYVRGKHLTYDDLGNLLTYNGKTHTWGEGRQLATFENGSVSAAYKYDENGLRTQKTVGNKTYSYTWANEKLVGSTDGTNALRFIYGSGSAPVGFTLNNTAVYLYLKNLQGDIVGIVDENGTTVVKYTYDAWGKPTSVTGTMASTIGEINPLRYRGYYYDSE